MAAGFNKVFLMGNLTRDIEVRTIAPTGTTVGGFGIAVNRQFRTKDGELRDEVTFVDCEAFGRTAETLSKYLRKGSPVLLEGRLKLDQWEDKQTQQKRSKLKVVLENVQFLSSRGAGGGQSSGGEESFDQSAPVERHTPPPRTNSRPTPPPQENIDEDVPF